MPGFLSPIGDLDRTYLSDYEVIDNLSQTGSLWMWGFNGYGQLGDGTVTNRSSPVRIAGTNWKMISGGGYHSVALKNDGTLWAWGRNDTGQVGGNVTTNRSSPLQIGSLSSWVQITCGYKCTLALNQDGTIWGLGSNLYTQLGSTFNYSSLTQVGVGSNWIQISAGRHHVLGLQRDGTIWAWGRNNSGQLGGSTTVSNSSPIQVHTSSNWIQVSAGGYHSAAIRSDNTLWTWGRNNLGQLGDGTTVNKSSPIQVEASKSWKKLMTQSHRSFNTFAITTTGTIWGVGTNNLGSLGDGTTIARSNFVQMIEPPVKSGATIGTTTEKSVASSGATFVIATTGELFVVGFNSNGDLGNNTTSNTSVHAQLGSAANWKQISAGDGHYGGIYFYEGGSLPV